MRVEIDAEGGGLLAAVAFAKAHVIVSRKDLARIKRLARQLGFYPQLKALDVKMREIEIVGMPRPRPRSGDRRKR